MAIIARDTGTKDFEPAPEGMFGAVCCDIVDKGLVTSAWGTSHKVQLRWQLDGEDAGLRDDGKPWLVVRQFTLSLHEKSSLRKFLESWRGRRFNEAELKDGFDLEKLLNVCCMLQVIHDMSADGKVYANVQNVVPLPKGTPRPVVREYVRAIHRGESEAPSAEDEEEEAF